MRAMALTIIFCLSALALLSLGTGFSNGASRQIGGSGLGFSCDVNTQKCRCDGVETGADCVAMKKNCSGGLTCLDPITYPGQPYSCSCKMSRAARQQIVKPSINGTLKPALK